MVKSRFERKGRWDAVGRKMLEEKRSCCVMTWGER